MDSIESLHAMVPARARDSVVEVFPRRKAGESASTPARGRSPVHLNYSAVAALFDTPQTEAARRLGISLTALKQASRKLGILRWPYTRLEKALARTKTLDLTEAGQVREPSRRGSESDVPRRKAGESASTPARGRSPVHLNYSAVAALFDTPQTEAARRLGISLTALKQASRKLGILRWPYTRQEKALARTKTLDPTEAGQVREPSRRGSESDGSLACASESTQPRLPKKCPSHAEFGDNVEAGCELGNDDLGWLLWTDTDRLDVSETEWQERVCAMYDVCTNGTQAYHGHHEGSTVFHM